MTSSPSLTTAPLPLSGQSGIGWSIRRPSPGRPGDGRHDQLGNFQTALLGRITPASTDLTVRLLPMSEMGLGRVKTPGGSIDAPRSRRGGHARSFFRLWRLFRSGSAPEADSRRLERFCNSRRTRVCDDYALITAMSGWTPKMFMTRVRL